MDPLTELTFAPEMAAVYREALQRLARLSDEGLDAQELRAKVNHIASTALVRAATIPAQSSDDD